MISSLPISDKHVGQPTLDVLFHEARSANGFLPIPVPRARLESIIEAAHLGPTAMNATPLRVLFIESPEAKERLLQAVMPGNVDKTREAPVTAILGYDRRWFEKLPTLFPHRDMSHIGRDSRAADEIGAYNAALQTGYFILAARAVGLDAGPMGGFDNAAVDREFFPDGAVHSQVLINLGYADESKTFPRLPRLEFSDVARYA